MAGSQDKRVEGKQEIPLLQLEFAMCVENTWMTAGRWRHGDPAQARGGGGLEGELAGVSFVCWQ